MDSREMEGAGCDADLEARLYAEIHYSNETYPDHMSNPMLPLTHQDAFNNPSHNIMPAMSAQYSTLLPQSNPLANAHGHAVPHNQWAIDPRPNYHPNNPIMYPENHQSLGFNTSHNNPSYHSSTNYPTNTGMFSKRPRALLDTPINPQYNYPSYQNASMPPPSARFNSNRGRGRNNHSSNMQPPYTANVPLRTSRFNDTNRRDKRSQTTTRTRPGSTANPSTSKDTTKDNPRNNSTNDEPNTSTSAQATVPTAKSPTNIDKTVNSPSRLPEVNADSTSKYNVTAKTKQQPRIKPTADKNSDDVSSDSDESIFEVPVPPKPAPLLINLNDSGDELSSSDDDEQSPVIMGNKTSESQPPPPGVDDVGNSSPQVVPSIVPSSSQSDELSRNNSTIETPTEINNEELSNDVDTIPSNIIINCTQVATGVTTLADIKRLRESTVTSINNLMSDEDSMTESEAMKWGQIEGQMTDNNDGDNASNQFQIQNPTNSVDRTIGNATGVDSTRVESTGESTSRQVDEVISGGGDSLNLERGVSRKRSRWPESGAETSDKSNDDRSKRRKSTNEMSFEEYVFQPMPKQLEQFYNAPRGGVSLLDVHKIQSRMPNNPNRWAILDADKGINLRSREKRKTCAVCQRTGHTRDKCPSGRPVPRCHMCGEIGHYEPRCPHAMCLTCGTKYSSYRKTCENCRNIQCNTCKSQGHTNENCPDLWRRYHQTTSGTSVNVPTNPFKILKPLNELSCSNCTKTGHHSTNCKKNRWSQHYQSPRFVSSYTKGPYYPQDEITIDDCDSDIIDLVDDDEDSDYNDNPGTQTIDKSNKQLLYEYSNVSKNTMKSWPMKIIFFKRINKLFQQRSNFFKRQLPNESKCLFGITINQFGCYHEIIIRTPSEKTLIIFEKLIRQVFDERRKMIIETSPPLPWDKSGLLSIFMNGLEGIVEKTKPKNLRYGAAIASIEKKLKSKKITKANRGVMMNTLTQAKSIVLLVSYNYGLIPNARETLYELQKFIKILAALSVSDDNSPVPADIYMTAVWFKLELFTAYVTEEMITAVATTRKKSQKELNLQLQFKMRNNGNCALFSPIITKDTLRKLKDEISCYSTINSVDNSEVQSSSSHRRKSGNKCGNEKTLQLCTEQLRTSGTCNGDVSHDDDSDDIIFLDTTNQVGSTSNNDKRISHVNSTLRNNNETLKVSTSTTVNTNERNVRNNANTTELKMPFDFPKPVLKKIIGQKGLIKYAKAAAAFARKNNLTSMIPKLMNAVNHAKLGSINKRDMLALWNKLNAIAPSRKKKRRTGTQRRRCQRAKKSRIKTVE